MNAMDALPMMRLVQWVEGFGQDGEAYDMKDKCEAADFLAHAVRGYIEAEAEAGGWYSELMGLIGEDDS